MKVSQLNIYPIKSTKGISLTSSEVLFTGLQYDRQWALFDENNKAITAREYPQLLELKTSVSEKGLTIHSSESIQIDHGFNLQTTHEVKIFSESATGAEPDKSVSQWFSNFLNTNCRFMVGVSDTPRPVLSEYGGTEGDIFYYADECPILLTTEETLSNLNDKLNTPVSMDRFRPNIVVKGAIPLDEDNWKQLSIGECIFDVAQPCKRCVMITIDPQSGEKDPDQEPLRTLATYRKHPAGGAAFGVHLIARKLGKISLDDEMTIL